MGVIGLVVVFVVPTKRDYQVKGKNSAASGTWIRINLQAQRCLYLMICPVCFATQAKREQARKKRIGPGKLVRNETGMISE